ncbi:hypothetical protein RvY_04351 [Ramazzottius varieornatus]|uniref:Gustatory receptor n=1 Tax=Ramazzottius varieornatus TaxID=947166 RepID=A0A1D1UY69_RAMVA|nr:hypothetical protein RvY_04351 [Ramazzottius varieornatus]
MLNDTSVLEPLPVKIRTWQYTILYFLFCFVPFVLAQQVFTVLLILSGVGADAIKNLNKEVKLVLKSHQNGFENIEELVPIPVKVALWEERYMAILEFVKLLNELFNWIFFAIYGSDFVAVLGFGARVINNVSRRLTKILFLLCSAAVYLTYETCFVVWPIHLHEESTRLPFSIYQLTVQVETGRGSVVDDKHDTYDIKHRRVDLRKNRLVHLLQIFEDLVYNFPCVISGAGLLDCTRGLVVRSLTLTLSLVVLAKELMDKSDHKTKSLGGGTPAHNTTL